MTTEVVLHSEESLEVEAVEACDKVPDQARHEVIDLAVTISVSVTI